jgi:hypothetical protein
MGCLVFTASNKAKVYQNPIEHLDQPRLFFYGFRSLQGIYFLCGKLFYDIGSAAMSKDPSTSEELSIGKMKNKR